MVSYDLTMRHLAQHFPQDMAFLSLGLRVDSVKTLSPDLPAREQRADWLAKARVGRKVGLVQTEFQSRYVNRKIEDMLGYRVQAKKIHRLPIFSVMILLSKEHYPGPGHNCLKETPFVDPEPQLGFHVREVRAWDLDPDEILKKGAIGLIPLIPLMKGHGKEPLEKAIAAASQIPDNKQRADVLTGIAVFGSLKYSRDLLRRLIRSETMKESPIYMEILQEGHRKGRKEGRKEGRMEGARRVLLRTLERRFTPIPAEVKRRLSGVRSLERLEELAEHTVTCRNLAAFSKLLD